MKAGYTIANAGLLKNKIPSSIYVKNFEESNSIGFYHFYSNLRYNDLDKEIGLDKSFFTGAWRLKELINQI